MKLLVLGSGNASGMPGWNDGSAIAARARAKDPDVPPRRGACLALSADGHRYSILEAPFHLAESLARNPDFTPLENSRAVPIDTLILTSSEIEASHGLLGLQRGFSARIASPPEMAAALQDHDAAFRNLAPFWGAYPWDRPFPLDREDVLEARFFPLPGPAPDHLREVAPRAGRSRCGVRITDTRSGARLVWAPRITKMDSATLAELRSSDLRIIDGTCYADSEARSLRPGARVLEEIGHLPIDGHDGSLAMLAGMSGRSIYIQMAASNPLCDRKSAEAERVRMAGIEVAEDEMEIQL